jgi:hypothetical protein
MMDNTDIFVEVKIRNIESTANALRQLRHISKQLDLPVTAKISFMNDTYVREFSAYPTGHVVYRATGQEPICYGPDDNDLGKQEREAAKVEEPAGVLRMETVLDELGVVTKHYYLRDGTYLGSDHDIPRLYAGLLTRMRESLASVRHDESCNRNAVASTISATISADEFHKRNAEGNAAQ